ncbi:MAG: cyanophycin synthetase [Bacteroidota bacterium]
MGKYFKVPHGKIKYALEHYVPTNNRSQNLEWGPHQVLLDAYNANPSSMEVTINNFAALPTGKRKVVILGDMLELGEATEQEHNKIAQLAQDKEAFDQVILVGSLFAPTAKELNITHFLNVTALKKWWETQKTPPSYILLKASRGIQLEQFIK